jgi:phosphatidylserine decarboxylase
LKLFFLFVISLPLFSRIWGYITKIEKPEWLAAKMISVFKDHYDIDMNLYEGDEMDYPSLSKFFIRPLNKETRPLTDDKNSFLSPSDGVVTVCEKVAADIATQVKGRTYSISDLVRKELDFSDGYYLFTIYLSPKDYHRYHVPVDTNVKSYIHTGWRLYPVNKLSVNSIEDLFVKNERVVVKMERDNHEFYYVAVGATFVGSIKMDFFTKPVDGKWTVVDKDYKQNQELGMFEMGSTIVLVVPENMVEELNVAQGETVKVGQPLFKLSKDQEK